MPIRFLAVLTLYPQVQRKIGEQASQTPTYSLHPYHEHRLPMLPNGLRRLPTYEATRERETAGIRSTFRRSVSEAVHPI
jgi:hypothetical protein